MALSDQLVRASIPISQNFTLVMVSSPGFGSYPNYLSNFSEKVLTLSEKFEIALLTLGFPIPSSLSGLKVSNLDKLVGSFFNRHTVTRSVLRRFRLRLFVGIRFQLLFHSPHRGAFHLSLTVLVHYRSLKVFSLIQ